MRIKGGIGYWETDLYPIGGSFHRAPKEGAPITEIIRRFERSNQTHGCNIEVRLASGKRAALNAENIEGNDENR